MLAVDILTTARAYVVPGNIAKQIAALLSSDSPLLAYVKELELQTDGLRDAISHSNFATPEGLQKAIANQGKLQGLIAAQEILFTLATQEETNAT